VGHPPSQRQQHHDREHGRPELPDDLAFDEVETAEGDLQEQDRVDHQPDHALSMRAQPPSQRAARTNLIWPARAILSVVSHPI
jgi:hypothetical protein